MSKKFFDMTNFNVHQNFFNQKQLLTEYWHCALGLDLLTEVRASPVTSSSFPHYDVIILILWHFSSWCQHFDFMMSSSSLKAIIGLNDVVMWHFYRVFKKSAPLLVAVIQHCKMSSLSKYWIKMTFDILGRQRPKAGHFF